jgi:hypothetical protein
MSSLAQGYIASGDMTPDQLVHNTLSMPFQDRMEMVVLASGSCNGNTGAVRPSQPSPLGALLSLKQEHRIHMHAWLSDNCCLEFERECDAPSSSKVVSWVQKMRRIISFKAGSGNAVILRLAYRHARSVEGHGRPYLSRNALGFPM